MKYIDAEKLITEIERRKEKWLAESRLIKKGKDNAMYAAGKSSGYTEFLSLVNSLQQEQEGVAERFARIVRGNLIGIDKEVQQKFEQLYFEVTGNKMYGGYND